MLVLALLLAAAPGKLVSVLELKNKLDAAEKVDAGYFTDRIRGAILEAKLGLRVMTRENMIVLVKAAGKKLEDCEGECEVDTGRLLGADYVISGEVLRIGTRLKVNLRLHETANGWLLGAATASGASADALDDDVAGTLRKLLASIPAETEKAEPPPVLAAPPVAAPPVAEEPPAVPTAALPAPALAPAEEAPGRAAPWAVVGVGGALLVGGGIGLATYSEECPGNSGPLGNCLLPPRTSGIPHAVSFALLGVGVAATVAGIIWLTR